MDIKIKESARGRWRGFVLDGNGKALMQTSTSYDNYDDVCNVLSLVFRDTLLSDVPTGSGCSRSKPVGFWHRLKALFI